MKQYLHTNGCRGIIGIRFSVKEGSRITKRTRSHDKSISSSLKYCTNMAVGLRVEQSVKHLHNPPVEADVRLDLLVGERAVAGGR